MNLDENLDEDYYLKSFMRSLKKRLAHRREWSVLENTSAYRLFDRENNIPLTVDVFNEQYAVVVAFLDSDQFRVSVYLDVIKKALGISDKRIFYKERRKLTSRQGYQKSSDVPSTLIQIREHNLFYNLNLSDYLDIGIFMDHRNLRKELINNASGLRVLNLFSYTGSFGVSAAAGGASSVINIDLSNKYLDIARENFQCNGLLGESFKFIRYDVMAWLEEEHSEYEHFFDIIVCDPPVFSNSRQMKRTLNIQRDYAWLIEKSVLLLKKKYGVLYFSTPLENLVLNHKNFPYLHIKEITHFTIPYDFRKHKSHRCWQIRWNFKSQISQKRKKYR